MYRIAGEKYGNAESRLYTMRSRDLEHWQVNYHCRDLLRHFDDIFEAILGHFEAS